VFCSFHDEPLKIENYIPNGQLMDELKRNFGIFIFCDKHKASPVGFLHKGK